MSGFFGALLRSAGAPPRARGTRPMPPAGSDLIEQEVEVEPRGKPTALAAQRIDTPPKVLPQAAQRTPSPLAEAVLPARPGSLAMAGDEPAPMPVAQPMLADDPVHPAVRAALQWVAADPARPGRVASDKPMVQAGAEALQQQARATTTTTSMPREPRRPSLQPRPWPAIEPRPQGSDDAVPGVLGRVATPAHPASSQEPDLALPRGSRAHGEADAVRLPPAPAAQDRVEVSIGTIHVRVDAPPPPPAVVQPAPPRERPQTAPAAARSGFARSRLPRI